MMVCDPICISDSDQEVNSRWTRAGGRTRTPYVSVDDRLAPPSGYPSSFGGASGCRCHTRCCTSADHDDAVPGDRMRDVAEGG